MNHLNDNTFEHYLDGIFSHNNAARDYNFDPSYLHDDISHFKK